MLTSDGLSAELQFRPGFRNPWRYPLLELFLANNTGGDIDWGRVLLDGDEVQPMKRGVVWSQFYPSSKVPPGQTVVLQICLEDAPEVEHKIKTETRQGHRVVAMTEAFPACPASIKVKHRKATAKGQGVEIPVIYDLSKQPLAVALVSFSAVTFSPDLQRVYIGFNDSALEREHEVAPPVPGASSGTNARFEREGVTTFTVKGVSTNLIFQRQGTPSVRAALPPAFVRISINGKDCTREMQVREMPHEGAPGLIVVRLPDALEQGRSLHVRAEASDGRTTQSMLRAWKGVFLDDFGIKEGSEGEKLRRELGLDAQPVWRMLPDDPACGDVDAGKTAGPISLPKHGYSMGAILATRSKWFEASDKRPCYTYLCTASDQNTYSIYGQCVDGIQVNPYRLGWSTAAKFIDDEAHYFRWGREVARPRPWFWIPEVFSHGKRMIEAEELRLLTYAALGHGCKGIKYYIYEEPSAPKMATYSQSPPLLAEIKKINAEIKKLEPILGPALFVSKQTIGSLENGARQYTLWSGDEGVLLIVRNLDYTTDREPNDLGRSPRFKYTPKTNVELTVHMPLWFREILSKNNSAKAQVLDPLTQEIIPHQEDAEFIKVTLARLDLGRILWIPTPK